MSIEIKAIAPLREYKVNGKIVYKNLEGKWIATQELTENEKRSFNMHIQAIESKLMPPLMNATYIS